MKNKIGIICMVLGLLCLSASSGLLIYNHQENTEAGRVELARFPLHIL